MSDPSETETAGEKMSAMWTSIADNIQARAEEEAASGLPSVAVEYGVIADTARWQATGEGDYHSMKDVLQMARRDRLEAPNPGGRDA